MEFGLFEVRSDVSEATQKRWYTSSNFPSVHADKCGMSPFPSCDLRPAQLPSFQTSVSGLGESHFSCLSSPNGQKTNRNNCNNHQHRGLRDCAVDTSLKAPIFCSVEIALSDTCICRGLQPRFLHNTTRWRASLTPVGGV